jgi:hypothetical protein
MRAKRPRELVHPRFEAAAATARLTAILVALFGAAACSGDDPNALRPGAGTAPICPPTTAGAGGASASSSTSAGGGQNASSGGSGGAGGGGTPSVLDERVLSYTEALRTAAFKLIGNAPTYAQMQALETSANQPAVYAQLVDSYMGDARFAARMVELWGNTFRMGNPPEGHTPSLDTAPTFAARLLVEGTDFREIFQRTSNTCPTFDPATGSFADGDCSNAPLVAGVLTDPGLLAHYYGNFAFARNRVIQEVFACRRQPAEYTENGTPIGSGVYTSPWPFESISGMPPGRVDFLDTSASMCANCHSTANHRSILFAAFDGSGKYVVPAGTDDFYTLAVPTPLEGTPLAESTDFLPPGEKAAWKYGVPADNLQALGQAMAEDVEIQACLVTRLYDYAFSKGDPVYDLATVPTSVLQPYLDGLNDNGFNLRATLRAIVLSDDFVRF